MGVNVSCFCEDTEEPLGIYAAEGMVMRSGSFLESWFNGGADTAFTVVCRSRNAAGRAEIKRLLSEFEQWFCQDFPKNLNPFSIEVVRRYWQSILGSSDNTQKMCVDAAVLLIHAGQYVFCNRGELTVYEYSYEGKKYRRWHTGRERELLDAGLGMTRVQTARFQFWHRAMTGKTLFIIVPKQVSLATPPKTCNRRRLKRFMDGLAGQVCVGAAVVS